MYNGRGLRRPAAGRGHGALHEPGGEQEYIIMLSIVTSIMISSMIFLSLSLSISLSLSLFIIYIYITYVYIDISTDYII